MEKEKPTRLQDKYETGYQEEPDWEDVSERLDTINVSDSPEERAEDVAANLASDGKDIYYLSLALHQVLVPTVESIPTDSAMKVQSPDGLDTTVLMNPEERAPLFDHAAKLIQQLDGQRSNMTNEEFLERASNIMALSIVLAHPFADGNGRTARMVGGLIRDGRQGADEDLKVLGKNRPDSGFRIMSYLPRDKDLSPIQVLDAAAALDVPLDQKEKYEEDSRLVFTTPYN